MQQSHSDAVGDEAEYHFCFYHVLTVKHANYHHVIMKLTEEELEMIKSLNADTYSYCLISAQPVRLSDSAVAADLIIRGLIMDGESLLKRFKAQHKKIHSTSNQE